MKALKYLWHMAHKYAMSIWIAVFTVLVAWALAQGHDAVVGLHESDDREAHEEVVEEAQRCVTSWETREDIRDAVERGTRGGARVGSEALIAIATEAQPETIAQYRAYLTQLADAEVAAARAEIPNPECDLSDARETLEE